MNSNRNLFGTVRSIYIALAAGEPMKKVRQIEAMEGLGLKGDRYASKNGFWQTLPKPRETIRDVSFIRASDIENSGFSEAETRRNIVVQTDQSLLDLINKHFFIGEVLFKGIEDCTPCKRPSELANNENFAQVFKGKGGLRAQVLKSGLIRESDHIFLSN